MTGFARVRLSSEAGEVVLTLKSVNHRGLDVHFRMSAELEMFETALRNAVKRRVARGHVQVRVSFTPASAAPVTLNRPLLDAYLAAFRQAASHSGLPAQPDLNSALSLPGMLREEDADPNPAVEQLLLSAMEQALDELDAFREREGRELAADLLERAATIRQTAVRSEQLRTRAVPAFQARLSDRLADLLSGISLDPQRVAQEAALLADKSDVAEELTRLRLHVAQLESLLAGGGEIGKKLDFLLQEMSREANTVLSKTSGLGEWGLAITEAGLQMKADIEKIREQALNLE